MVMDKCNIKCRVLGYVMGRWNIRCRVLEKGLRFVDVLGRWNIRYIGFWEKVYGLWM